MKFRAGRIFLVIVAVALSSGQIAAAEVGSDRASTLIPPAGPGGYTRITFNSLPAAANYSIVPNDKHSTFTSVLPVCDQIIREDCVIGLAFRKSGDLVWKEGVLQPSKNPPMDGVTAITFTRDGSSQNYGEVSQDKSKFRPLGRTSSTWKLDGAKHAGGDEYLVSAVVSNFPRQYIQDAFDFNLSITPVLWRTPTNPPLYDRTANSTTSFNFPTGFEFRLKIKLGLINQRVSTWFNGRVSNPEIELKDDVLSISGSPIKVPIAGSDYIKCADIKGNQLRSLEKQYGPLNLSGSMCTDLSGSIFGFDVLNESIFDFFSAWEEKLKEFGKNSFWYMNSTKSLETCDTKNISGFATSDALLYTPYPPTINKGDNSLSYQIASTHLDSTGQVNKGQFDLVLLESLAQCLWGISPSSLSSAKLQVTYADGNPIVGTSTLKVHQGWVYIKIADFTFSSPTFRIKAIEMKPVEPGPIVSPTPTPTPTPVVTAKAAPKRTTITCVKGKTTKKVTALKPKCPVGFKKK
jgi:hypothetical protein